MDFLMMPGKATCSFELQETLRTGEGGMWTTRWISHTVKTESVDTRLAMDLSVFTSHTTTQANSHVLPKRNSSNPNKSPTLVPIFCTCSYSTTLQSLLHPLIAAGFKLWQAMALTAKGRRKWRLMTVRSMSSISTVFIFLVALNHPNSQRYAIWVQYAHFHHVFWPPQLLE
jgi:hypothetical protein